MTGESANPSDPVSGGQAMALESGLNLIGISADVCYYVSPEPGEAERAMIPVTSPANYVEVPSINSLLGNMGIADKTKKIMGWHPDPSGGSNKMLVKYENSPSDTLTYLAGGYGYWVEVSDACILKVAGKARLKGMGSSKTVKLYPGWNLMDDLFTKVHYEGSNPEAVFESDETGRVPQSNMCDYLRNLIRVDGAPLPGAVHVMMMAYDKVFPHVRTYYKDIPAFLQTLKYAGPGMGMLIKIDPAATGPITLEYPAENE